MIIMDSFRRPLLAVLFRIGVNSRRHFGRSSVIALKVSYRPFEDLRAVSASNRFMAQTDLEPHLMPTADDCLNRLMSDRG